MVCTVNNNNNFIITQYITQILKSTVFQNNIIYIYITAEWRRNRSTQNKKYIKLDNKYNSQRMRVTTFGWHFNEQYSLTVLYICVCVMSANWVCVAEAFKLCQETDHLHNIEVVCLHVTCSVERLSVISIVPTRYYT